MKSTSKLIDSWLESYHVCNMYGDTDLIEVEVLVSKEKELVKRGIDLANLKKYAKNVQRVKIKKHDDRGRKYVYEANPADQPGSPRVGIGPTPFMALKDLLMNNKEFNIHLIDETGELE